MQLDLFNSESALSPDAFVAFLNAGARRHVEVTFTQNRVSMVSVQFPLDGPILLRVHEVFLAAGLEVRLALKQYLRTRRKAPWAIIAEFSANIPAESRGAHAKRAPKSPPSLPTRGSVYDLKLIYMDVNACYFSGRVKCRIGWGRDRATARRRGRRSKSIRYGSWNPESEIIRLHPRLDDTRVPADFVRYIVFHEMLHTVVPTDVHKGRRRDHPPAFNALERQFPEIDRMHTLARELLDVLV